MTIILCLACFILGTYASKAYQIYKAYKQPKPRPPTKKPENLPIEKQIENLFNYTGGTKT